MSPHARLGTDPPEADPYAAEWSSSVGSARNVPKNISVDICTA